MARTVIDIERRRGERLPPELTPWPRLGLLRPGQEVRVLNIGRGGALVESPGRILPGTRAELHLMGQRRLIVLGRVDRCRVTALDPVRYEGAIVFDHRLEWNIGAGSQRHGV